MGYLLKSDRGKDKKTPVKQIKHKLNWGNLEGKGPENLLKFWKRGFVGVRCSAKECTDPESEKLEDHSGDCKDRLEGFQNWVEPGALVIADYGSKVDNLDDEKVDERIRKEIRPLKSKMLIGKIPNEPDIKVRGDWSDPKGSFWFIQLEERKEIKQTEYPVFWSGKLSRSTYSGVDELEKQVHYAYRKEKLPPEPESLTTDQQEQLCSEYLRKKYPDCKIKYQLIPSGSLRNFDIHGITENGKIIFAEVTDSSGKVEEKKNTLKGAEGADMKILFGPKNSEPENLDNVKYISLDEVIQSFQGSELLNRMLGKP